MTDLLTRTLDPPAPEFAGSVAAALAVVVAPSSGRFQPLAAPVRRRVLTGQLLGHVTGGRGRADEVRSPLDGVVQDLLVRDGQIVRRGQGLIWLNREAIG